MATYKEVWNRSSSIKPIQIDSNCVNAVKVLHRTVVCLRTALEKSQSELSLLKSKALPSEINLKPNNAVKLFSSENNLLEPKISSEISAYKTLIRSNNLHISKYYSMDDINEKTYSVFVDSDKSEILKNGTKNLSGDGDDSSNVTRFEFGKNTESKKSKINDKNAIQILKTKGESEESEIDDIELIFTTDDVKNVGMLEELESITDDGDTYESKLEINQSKIGTQSVLVETDISKCGIVSDHGYSYLNPVIQTTFGDISDNLKKELNRRMLKFFKPSTIRSIKPSRNGNTTAVRDSETQTDISAIPPHWKSESFLINSETPHHFPTLPSKFALPSKESNLKYPLKPSDKTQETRRILLSDINFTSMVPELSRSVDHLHHNGLRIPNSIIQSSLVSKFSQSPVISGSSNSKFEFNVGNSNWNCYDNSFSSDYEKSVQDLYGKRNMWRPSMFSLDMYYLNRTSSVPPSPTLRRHSAAVSYSSSYGTDTHFYYPLPDKLNTKTSSNSTLKNSNMLINKPKTKVSFKEMSLLKNTVSRQSLPNMHVETGSVEESTELLIDESEDCIQKSVETAMSNIDWPFMGYRFVNRTFSVPNLFIEFSPPLSARPFIARTANDLKINYFAKVINKEGRVVGGRIQFVGNLPEKVEPHIGIVLPPNLGENDGTFQGRRYFTCDRNCGLFVPFRKVVMAWKES